MRLGMPASQHLVAASAANRSARRLRISPSKVRTVRGSARSAGIAHHWFLADQPRVLAPRFLQTVPPRLPQEDPVEPDNRLERALQGAVVGPPRDAEKHCRHHRPAAAAEADAVIARETCHPFRAQIRQLERAVFGDLDIANLRYCAGALHEAFDAIAGHQLNPSMMRRAFATLGSISRLAVIIPKTCGDSCQASCF